MQVFGHGAESLVCFLVEEEVFGIDVGFVGVYFAHHDFGLCKFFSGDGESGGGVDGNLEELVEVMESVVLDVEVKVCDSGVGGDGSG